MVGAMSGNTPRNEWMGKKWETPQWEIDLSKRFNAALRHSVGCVKDKKGHFWIGLATKLDGSMSNRS